MKKALLIYFFSLLIFEVQAQSDPLKWGKIADSELKMMQYEPAPEADAIVLYDYGQIEFDNYKESFLIHFNRHTRIKILKKSGFDYANISIPFFDFTSSGRIENLKAHTLNLGSDGKVERIEVDKKDIYIETISGKYKQLKFTFPQIKEGSVIEFSYKTLSDDFANLETWYFQKQIPVLHSELRTKIPEYLTYFSQVTGITSFDVHDKGQFYQTVNSARTKGGFLKFTGEKNRYVLKDVPAFISEPYLSSAKNYLMSISFQLRNIKHSGLIDREYNSTWESLCKDLIDESEWFGWQLNLNRGLKSVAEAQTEGLTDPQEKMIRIYDYVRNNISWNGQNRIFTDKYLNRIEKDGTGSSAEINLLLTLLLQFSGIDAQPMLASTKPHGSVQTFYPMLSQFNTVLTYVQIDSLYYILNATDKYRPYFLLDDDDLNQMGFVVNKNNPQWVQIHAYKNSRQTTMANIKLNEEGIATGNISISGDGYFGWKHRSMLASKGQNNYNKEYLAKNIPGFEVANLIVKNKAEVEVPLAVSFEVKSNDFTSVVAGQLLFSPMLIYGLEQNPFKLEERTYPVNYGFRSEETFILNLDIPEGYILADVPGSVNVHLPGNSAQFMYVCQPQKNHLQLITKLKINKEEFSPEEYANLRKLYTQVVSKQAEKIVIKKM